MVVETTNSGAGTLSTREFTNATGLAINDLANASPYPSSITVSNIANEVTAIRVKLNGLTHAFPDDVDAFLVGPRGTVCTLVSDAGGGGWSFRLPGAWSAVASSFDGAKLVASASGGPMFTSTDFGVNWMLRNPIGPTNWSSAASARKASPNTSAPPWTCPRACLASS